MRYPIIIHKDAESDYGVTIPDLPGCYTAGLTVDDAMMMAAEAASLHLEAMLDEGEPIPEPSDIQALRDNPDYADGTWAYITLDTSTLANKSRRINITLPERTLQVIDQFANDHHESRSGLLLRAVTHYMNEQREKSSPIP